MTQLRRFTQFHEHPAVIAWWLARLGSTLAWLVPSRRRLLLALASLAAAVMIPLSLLDDADDLPLPSDGIGTTLVIFALMAMVWLVFQAARHFSRLPSGVRRHPQLTLHAGYWACLLLLWNTAPESGLWRSVLLGVAVVLPFLLWRCGYLLMSGQYGRMAGARFSDHLIYLWPAYGGNDTPYGKGLDYLSRHEAKDAEALARSQLSGLRLILLGVLWGVTLYLMEGLFYGEGNGLSRALGLETLLVPALGQVIKQGGAAPLLDGWASVYCELFKQVLRHAAGGHVIIGILRLFGFNVFRNTYKPLLAESVSEFWNRFYYYFKELLTHFFFLPVFSGIGRKLQRWPNLRMLAAVMAAAFFGNMYYHLLRLAPRLAEGELLASLYSLRSRFFYCFLLAVGIYLSMRREQARQGRPLPGGARRWLRILGVWTFFGLIFIWNVRGRAGFQLRVEFFLGLFGLS